MQFIRCPFCRTRWHKTSTDGTMTCINGHGFVNLPAPVSLEPVDVRGLPTVPGDGKDRFNVACDLEINKVLKDAGFPLPDTGGRTQAAPSSFRTADGFVLTRTRLGVSFVWTDGDMIFVEDAERWPLDKIGNRLDGEMVNA